MLISSVSRSTRTVGLVAALALIIGTTTTSVAAETAPLTDGPWTEVWSMPLRGEERTFLDYAGNSYLAITAADLADPDFVDDKEVALRAKFAALIRSGPTFYGLDGIAVEGEREWWAKLIDGDNVHLLGTAKAEDGGLVLEVEAVVPARSDAEIIAERLDAIAADDYQARIDLAGWIRRQAEREGNTTYWLTAADDLIRETITHAAAAAAAAADVDLLQRTMEWAITQVDDPDLAAELGSAAWIHEADESAQAAIAARMQSLGYVRFGSGDDARWLTQSEALVGEFHQRFEGMHWRDVDGYFELGRWADRHADVLPGARQLAQKAYRAGLQADPAHAGIRHELGLPPATGDQGARRTIDQDFTDPESGLVMGAPENWDRSATPVVSSAAATWVDPRSDSAYLALRVIDDPSEPSFDAVWRDQVALQSIRSGYRAGTPREVGHSEGQARQMDFRLRAGDEERPAQLLVVYDSETGYGASLVVGYRSDEAAAALEALQSAAEQLRLPERPEPEIGSDDLDEAAPGANAEDSAEKAGFEAAFGDNEPAAGETTTSID